MGGEKLFLRPLRCAVYGSPPRGRGKGVSNVLVPEKFGITPAWAGKSRYRCRCWSGGRDHPRMGGEKVLPEIAVSCAVGSPPRRRGKETRPDIYRQLSRITPAWAGKRLSPVTPYNPPSDHPRMGGEKPRLRSRKIRKWGSPPRRRGKGAEKISRRKSSRITPAWAGKRRY